MKFVTFVASDHRRLGVGKQYKTVIDPTIILLRVVEHRPMGYIALESVGKDPIFQLRVEFHFCRGGIRANDTGSGPFCAPKVLGKSDQFATGASTGDHPCASEPGSGLGVKIFFRQPSFLFQNTIGAVLRTVINRQLNHSLHNLRHILPHVERNYGVLS
ncbi:uncharacterized protein LOC131205324 [Anopheles bellator]|uniref:uncharacterized protein LOC131205324 n=1 Tax=Anopheles bellator TaxID=139047 RepID=UPI00264863F2|nr:uncharacterized protein LOC131205324 [Anopheles bellator]